MTGTAMRRDHDFEHPRYVIDWDGGAQSDIWPDEDPDLAEHVEIWPGGLNRVGL